MCRIFAILFLFQPHSHPTPPNSLHIVLPCLFVCAYVVTFHFQVSTFHVSLFVSTSTSTKTPPQCSMWQVLLAAAVAGSTGYVTKHFLAHRNNNTDPLLCDSHNNQSQQHPTVDNADDNNVHDPDAVFESGSVSNSGARDGDGVFTFSSSEGGSSMSRPKKNRVRVSKAKQRSGAEVRSGRRRLSFCLKKRKTTKNSTAEAGFCSSVTDNSLFGWGLGFGIMCMMSAGKAEINNLNKTMDEAAKVVQELKSELKKRKSQSCAHQIPDSFQKIDMNYGKVSGGHDDELMLKKVNIDVIISSPAVNDGGECGSSTLTEEPERRVPEMNQLEAELEFELQKLSGGTIDSPCHEGTRQKLDEDEGFRAEDYLNFNYSQSRGVSPFELNQKLSHLLIKQQESHIAELESELHQAQSNLHQKEAELHALKDCVRRLTELSISTVSDDETQALTDPNIDWDNNNVDSDSKQSIDVGVKRPIDSESCEKDLWENNYTSRQNNFI